MLEILFKEIYRELSFWSLKTECLWLKVPLPESCPTNLTGYPSSKRDPNAKDSAVPQSIPFLLITDFFLKSKILEIVLCIFILGGMLLIFSEIF